MKATRKQAMLSMCAGCLGYWSDGKVDCEAVKCPLYTWQPYRKKEPDIEWTEYNPVRRGRITWEESKREMSEEAKAAFVQRTQGARGLKREPVGKIGGE